MIQAHQEDDAPWGADTEGHANRLRQASRRLHIAGSGRLPDVPEQEKFAAPDMLSQEAKARHIYAAGPGHMGR